MIPGTAAAGAEVTGQSAIGGREILYGLPVAISVELNLILDKQACVHKPLLFSEFFQHDLVGEIIYCN